MKQFEPFSSQPHETQTSAYQKLLEELEALKYSYERFQIAAENSSEIVLDYNIVKDTIYHTTNLVEELYGIPQFLTNAKVTLINSGIIHPDSVPDFEQLFLKVDGGAPRGECIIKTQTTSGAMRWGQLILVTVFDDGGKPVRAIGVLKDITSQRSAELQYENEQLFRVAMERNALLAYVADITNRKVLSGLEPLFGSEGAKKHERYEDALQLLLEAQVHPEDRPIVAAALDPDELLNRFARGNSKMEVEYRRQRADDTYGWVRGTAYLTDDPQSGSIRVYFYLHDIDAAKQEMLELQRKAEQDLLTGLYNKVTTEQLVREAVREPLVEGRMSAFLIVDLDNFKDVNDTMGHAFGDAVLSQVAHNLRGFCRWEDIAGRIGGDEFALYLKNLPNIETVERKAEAICEMFHQSAAVESRNYKISGTVGVALMPLHGGNFEDLYQKADTALYVAKQRGKDTFCLYREEMEEGQKVRQNRAEIDESAGKTFAENIIEYVFRILYESQDLHVAINGVLELISRHFGFSRAFLHEAEPGGKACRVTLEWCASDALPLPEQLRRLEGEQLASYHKRFREDGLYIMRRADDMPQEDREISELKGLHFRFHYALGGGGRFHGYVGFDQADSRKVPGPARISVLQGVAQMLDIFLGQHYAANELKATDTMLQAISDNMQTCTYIIDPQTHILQFINRSTADTIPLAEVGTFCYETIRGESAPCLDCPIDKMLLENRRSYQMQLYMPPYRMWARIDTRIVELTNGKEYALFNGHDFTEYKNIENEFIVDVEAFTKDARLYRALSASTDDYIYMCDMPKNLFYFPRAMTDDFALPSQIIEDAIPLWGTHIHPNEQGAYFQEMSDLLAGKINHHNMEYRARDKDGEWVWLRCRGYLSRDGSGQPLLFAGLITNLEKKGKIDHISGLPNKYEFERSARMALTKGYAGAEILLLGLDNFKSINSLYGWEFGDRVLREFAKQIQAVLPEEMPIYRMDGDKFGLFLSGESGEDATEIFQLLQAVFQNQQEYEGIRYHCTISGGVALAGRTPVFSKLLKEAEYALEFSKEEGKNCLCRYDEKLMSGRDREFTLIERLRECVENDFANFEVYYQPQVDAKTQKLQGAEALLRWQCEPFGAISPLEFIPLLEQSGLIHQVGRWVLLQAARTCEKWRGQLPDFTVSVNVSYIQLRGKNYVEDLAMLAAEGLIIPACIHLELTESCIVSEDTQITVLFAKLRQMGFDVALDDFGTGYSSLAILKNAPADVVKLDRSFVSNITNSTFDATFIQIVTSLCHSVGIEVCLEGVETWEEFELVRPMGLDLIQGYLFGRPVNVETFESSYLSPGSYIL